MKRYLLFAGDRYYANAAWCDFKGDFDTAEQATIHAQGLLLRLDWCQVVDTDSRSIVHSEGNVYGRLNDQP